jgi:CDP-4-dehydro-6-deoxyglucose reductase/ferredoxin-NAD(P)+ reductase (naphthalene dioxygenase ferredoxin-specific)
MSAAPLVAPPAPMSRRGSRSATASGSRALSAPPTCARAIAARSSPWPAVRAWPPIKSIVERALQKALPQHIYFYFGVRGERDLYLHDHFAALAEKHKNLHFIPVLSEDGDSSRRQGLVHEAVAQDFDEVDGCKAYLAGPPVMVEAATLLLEHRGMRRVDIHADAFYTAAEMASAGKKTGADQ